MTQCQFKVITMYILYIFCIYFAVVCSVLRPIQGSTHAVMDLDVKQRNSHYVVLQLENWYTNMKLLLID